MSLTKRQSEIIYAALKLTAEGGHPEPHDQESRQRARDHRAGDLPPFQEQIRNRQDHDRPLRRGRTGRKRGTARP